MDIRLLCLKAPATNHNGAHQGDTARSNLGRSNGYIRRTAEFVSMDRGTALDRFFLSAFIFGKEGGDSLHS